MTRETSIAAYREIEARGLLSPARFRIYKILTEEGPLTAAEIEVKIHCTKSPSRGSNVHARLCELREVGVVDELPARICSITNMTVIVWGVTNNLPTKPKKTKLKRRDLEKKIKELEEENELLFKALEKMKRVGSTHAL